MGKTHHEPLGPSIAALPPPQPFTAVGVSRIGWTHALRAAVRSAARRAPDVTGVDVIRTHAVVRGGTIAEFHVEVAVAAAPPNARPSCGEPW